MWKLHIFVNQTYRDLLHGTLKGQQHVVTRRKVEKLYNTYLKTALLFYKGYFQRLQALHGMPQIPRINSLLQMKAPDAGEVQNAQIPTDAVKKSFYTTLLHLGDISRWRNKARPRPDGLKTAVLFYELAHDLNPRSGAAHHQLGITEGNNHLHVVYHLYRAFAIESPHPNAMPNLEQEFRKLLHASTPGRRSGPPDPDEAFSNWFTKLHARFYKGEEYSQELEEEVLHRLEIALKRPGALPLLLKMVLINMAAYYVAKQKVAKEWSVDASNSCQYILRLNVRWTLILSRLLQSELLEYVKAAPPAGDGLHRSGNEGNPKNPQQISIFTETLLPLARIYMAWVFIYRADIVEYQDHLGSYVFDMYRALAQCLTMVAKEFKAELTASPYLLAEDIEALGMKPFDDLSLAPVCRLQHEFGKDSFKPHWEDRDFPKNSPEQEMKSRIYDLMNCGFSLALDERFPLGITTSAPQDSGEAITISYIEGGKPSPPVQSSAAGPQPAREESQSLQRPSLEPSREVLGVIGDEEALGVGMAATKTNSHGHSRARSGSGAQYQEESIPSRAMANENLETESDLGFRMNAMVESLVGGDDSDFDVQPRMGLTGGLGNSSYGMHAQRQGVSDAFSNNSLSWNAFPDPPQPGARHKSPTTTLQQSAMAGINAGSPNTLPGVTRSSTLQASVSAFTPGVRPQSGSEERSLSPGNAIAFGNQFAQSGLAFGRPSSGFSGSAHGSLGHARQRFGGSTDSSGASPFLSPKGDTRAYRAAAVSHSADEKAKSVSPPSAFGWGNGSFSTAFSQNASGLPAVNSPYGLPVAQFDGGFAQRDPFSHYQTYSGPTSSWPQHQQPSNLSLISNGNLYDATTAYGRGEIATKDDPTHFRNAVKGTSMAAAVAEADAYDRAVLESALSDDQVPPKR